MASERKVTRQHKPTGQELDRQYDELHEEHDADEAPDPEEQRQEKAQEPQAYTDDLNDPD